MLHSTHKTSHIKLCKYTHYRARRMLTKPGRYRDHSLLGIYFATAVVDIARRE